MNLFASAQVFGAIQLNDDPNSGGGVILYELTPDATRVVYTGDLNTLGDRELFSASISAEDTQFQINTLSVAGTDVLSFELAPDGTIVFRGDLEINGAFEVYSASSSTPNTQVKLNDDAPAAGQGVSQSIVTPGGGRVIYAADLLVDNETELYSATVGSPNTQLRLSNKPVMNGDVGTAATDIQSTPDGMRAVYTGDLDTDGEFGLYSAPTDEEGLQIKLSTVLVDRGFNLPFLGDFLLTSDGARVLYRGDADGHLYSAPTDMAGMEIQLSNAPSGLNIDFLRLAADDSRVTYSGQLETAGVRELFSADPAVAASQVKLNETPVAGGGIGGQIITPNPHRVVFTGDLDVLDQTDLYSAPTDMAGGQIQLNTNTVGPDGDVGSFLLNADGSRVIYSGDLNANTQFELYSALTTSEDTQITLSTNNSGEIGGVGQFILTPDTTRAVISGTLATPNVFDLFSVATDTAGTQVQLTNLAEGQNIFNFEVSPDSQWVVYDFDSDGDFMLDQLYAVDILGQNAPILLSDPLVENGQIQDFIITPDSQTVIYRASQDVMGENELFAASLVAPLGLPGDYNGDGTVDAADYTVYRDNLGTDFDLNGNGDENGMSAGIVDEADYDLWVAHFGETSGSGAASIAPGDSPGANYVVPEPASAWLLLAGSLFIVRPSAGQFPRRWRQR